MKNKHKSATSLKSIQRLFTRSQIILIVSLALFLSIAEILINFHFETEKRDRNLQNVAEAIASSPILTLGEGDMTALCEYLDTLKETLDDIDVISVVKKSGDRIYHSNHALIGTKYDGNLPEFARHVNGYYTVNENGPSGSQRRAYAAIYNEKNEYIGFVMAIMLTENIKAQTLQMLLMFLIITIVAILIEIIVAGELSEKVKKGLLGYEPDVFTAMYKMRDNILENLKEGILATDNDGTIQFANNAAVGMLCGKQTGTIVGQNIDVLGDDVMIAALKDSQTKEFSLNSGKKDIIFDRIPIEKDNSIVGTIAVLHNRAEYTKLMEDLSGTRYLVDSMRANNHDFTNKLHVILGLIQMEMYDEAISYIQNITIIQRENISRVMNAISEPSVAALLIGKIARASELNIHFVLREGSVYSPTDLKLPSEMLITVIGNLLDNAFEAMDGRNDFDAPKELLFGIFSRPDAVLITVDDTGSGIAPEALAHIFDNGFSTKGTGRGTGLYQVKKLVETMGGKITVESQIGVGCSFSVTFTRSAEHV